MKASSSNSLADSTISGLERPPPSGDTSSSHGSSISNLDPVEPTLEPLRVLVKSPLRPVLAQGCSRNQVVEFQPPIKQSNPSSIWPSLGEGQARKCRNKQGRFEKGVVGAKIITQDQKNQNAVASRVTKIKKTIVTHMKKIQELRLLFK